MNTMVRFLLSTMLILIVFAGALSAQVMENEEGVLCANGFELHNLAIDGELIYAGGPGKDGIPALKKPEFIGAEHQQFLADDEQVVGVYHNGEAKAYPVKILNYHEVINDQFGEEKEGVVVTYSPLCASGRAFRAEVGGKDQEFAVTGLVFNNNLLFYDRKTESVWSQLKGQAVAGRESGRQLDPVATEMTTWGDWKSRFPETKVLSRRTGHDRNYEVDPYYSITASDRLMFPVGASNEIMPLREKVIGIERNGIFKAYPFSVMGYEGKEIITDELMGEIIQVHYNAAANSARITTLDGAELPAVTTYWFSWFAFYPDTEVYFYGDGIEAPLSSQLGMSMSSYGNDR